MERDFNSGFMPPYMDYNMPPPNGIDMNEIYKDMKFILGFIFLVILIQSFVGDVFAEKFLLIVLMSMIILNAKPFITFLKNTFN